MKKRKFTKKESLLISFLEYCNKYTELKLEFFIDKLYVSNHNVKNGYPKCMLFINLNDFKRFLRKTHNFRWGKKIKLKTKYRIHYKINYFKIYIKAREYPIGFCYVEDFYNANQLLEPKDTFKRIVEFRKL